MDANTRPLYSERHGLVPLKIYLARLRCFASARFCAGNPTIIAVWTIAVRNGGTEWLAR
jgi:hypothetical protein